MGEGHIKQVFQQNILCSSKLVKQKWIHMDCKILNCHVEVKIVSERE